MYIHTHTCNRNNVTGRIYTFKIAGRFRFVNNFAIVPTLPFSAKLGFQFPGIYKVLSDKVQFKAYDLSLTGRRNRRVVPIDNFDVRTSTYEWPTIDVEIARTFLFYECYLLLCRYNRFTYQTVYLYRQYLECRKVRQLLRAAIVTFSR